MVKEEANIPKAKKCDYCDDYARHKIKKDELYSYLCAYCFKNLEQARAELNE